MNLNKVIHLPISIKVNYIVKPSMKAQDRTFISCKSRTSVFSKLRVPKCGIFSLIKPFLFFHFGLRSQAKIINRLWAIFSSWASSFLSLSLPLSLSLLPLFIQLQSLKKIKRLKWRIKTILPWSIKGQKRMVTICS